MSLATVRVQRRGEDRLAAGHPWVYSSDIADRGSAQPGDVVRVVNGRGRPLGAAHYSSSSQITLRLLSPDPGPIERRFYLDRLAAALAFRRRAVSNSDAWRWVHSEADGLPALVVDRYADSLAVQFLSQGMDRARDVILDCLRELFPARAIVARHDAPARKHEGLDQSIAVVSGELTEPVEVAFNGLRWRANLLDGQKTGVYLDQRENYLAAARWAHGEALDCFTSAGGFALHLAANCTSVEAVDSGAAVLAAAEANRALNEIANVTFREANVFDLLAGYAARQRRFDTIVLDPPAFAKNKASLEAATRGYRDINAKALRLLNPGGVLVTCSCSYHFNEALLLETVAAAALDAGRKLRVLDRRTQAADHPILLTVPETMYLKCLIFEALC